VKQWEKTDVSGLYEKPEDNITDFDIEDTIIIKSINTGARVVDG
jgi:hypothetical protein